MFQLLSKTTNDTNRIKILNAISYRYFTIDPKLGLQYGEKAKSLAEKLQWKKGLAGANKSLGTNYWALKESVKAQDYFWAALKISEELHDEPGIAKGIHSLGVLYGTNGDYATALDCYQKAANIFEKLGDHNALAGCYSNIANMLEGLGRTEETLKYYRLSLALAEKLNNTYSTAYYKALLGAAYFRQGENETALKLGMEALKIYEKLNDTLCIAGMLVEIGNIYNEENKRERAISQYKKGLALYKTINGIEGYANVSRVYGHLANVYTDQLLLEKAVSFLQLAIEYANKAHYKEGLRQCYLNLSQIYEKQQKPSLALQLYKQHIALRDSLNDFDHTKEMTRHELTYKFEKQKDSLSAQGKIQKSILESAIKEEQLTKSRYKEKWLYTIIITILLIASFSYFFIHNRLRSLKLKNELLREKTDQRLREIGFERQLNEANISAIRAQLNPHFMFNSLNAIQELIVNHRNEDSQIYLERFARLLRMLLENADQAFVSLRKEIHFIELYLSLEKLRIPDLNYSIRIDPDLDLDKVIIPNMILQPYLENAIWHGLKNKQGEKRLELNISNSCDRINYQVKDNGIGRQKASELKLINQKTYRSKGMELLSKRFNLLSKEYGESVSVEIIDITELSESSGTIVNISVPVSISKVKTVV